MRALVLVSTMLMGLQSQAFEKIEGWWESDCLRPSAQASLKYVVRVEKINDQYRVHMAEMQYGDPTCNREALVQAVARVSVVNSHDDLQTEGKISTLQVQNSVARWRAFGLLKAILATPPEQIQNPQHQVMYRAAIQEQAAGLKQAAAAQGLKEMAIGLSEKGGVVYLDIDGLKGFRKTFEIDATELQMNPDLAIPDYVRFPKNPVDI